jgi:hypothetical protein
VTVSDEWEEYWVYDIYEPADPPQAMVSQEVATSKIPEPNVVTVYRPVFVGVNDDGETYAYFYDTDADSMDVYETGGKRYVPTQQVHKHPPSWAEPAYKYE